MMFKRFGRWLLQADLQQMTETIHLLKDAYLDGPWVMPPSTLAAQMAQTGPNILGETWTDIQVDLLSQLGYGGGDSDYEREIAVQSSRRLWRYDVLTQWAIWLWTYYGFGQQINITLGEPARDDVFMEFWEADRNIQVLGPTRLPRLSHRLLVDGEFAFLYFTSTIDYETTVRVVTTDDINEIVYDEEDGSVVLWYKVHLSEKVGDVYIVDYMHRMTTGAMGKMPDRSAITDPNARTGDDLRSNTIVSLQVVAYNQKGMINSERGWPLATAGAPWARTYKSFMEDRASLAAAIATYAYKAKVKGGSRGVEAMRSRLEQSLGLGLTDASGVGNYAPARAAGGIAIENESMDLQKLQFGTGASDAKVDGEGLLTVAALGLGLFPHYMGSGDAFRLATATAMETPLLRQWTAYQSFWAAQFRTMARYVWWAYESHGGDPAQRTAPIRRTQIDVSTDRLLDIDTQELATAAASLVRDTLIPLAGVLPPDTILRIVGSLWKMLLTSFGVPNADELTNDAAFGIPDVAQAEALQEMLAHSGHTAVEVQRACPFEGCEGGVALSYGGHKGLLVCATCHKTFDPAVE